ncbi:hypothetical protein FF80_01422 [Devosia sp. LC5]|uniref:hypothetical protein n=1 Tax=Devosia sp. LC5 TaxID=1502724 RepID=UPI0004E381DF|nr:hypothetical protein [Devosia sp. LC5]KFC69154.1 hypothetical protein FF80_01422 [Devosia sp. LC5]
MIAPAPTSRATRVGQLDLFRYLTVTLAIISHIVIHHAIYDETEGGWAMAFKVVTRMATPSLLVLMGVMIEIANAHRMRGREPTVFAGLLYRSLLCALTYLVFSIINNAFALLNGLVPGERVQWVTEGYGAIFLTYALLLAIAPLWLWLRVRFGFLPVVLLSLAGVLVHTLLLADLAPLPPPFRVPGSVLLGIGGDRGPTVLHGLGLMTFGMAMGNAVFAQTRQKWARATVIFGCIVSFFLLATFIWYWGVGRTAHFISDIEHWRHHNHPGYYAFGILAALGILGLTYAVHSLLPAGTRNVLQTIGSNTLVYFFIGSVLLQAVPIVQITSPVAAIVATLTYLVVFGALTFGWARSVRGGAAVASLTNAGRDLIELSLRRTFWRPSE